MVDAITEQERASRLQQLQHQMEYEEAAANSEARAAGKKQRDKKRFPISTVEVGIWLIPASFVDFFELLGQLLVAIPVIGPALAGASSIMGMVFSGIMGLTVVMWLAMKGVLPTSRKNIIIYTALLGTVFGNAVMNWFPAWFGFFLWLFFITHKKTQLLHTQK